MILVSLLIGLVTLVVLFFWSIRARKLDVPQPKHTFFFGHLLETRKNWNRFYDWHWEQSEKYGRTWSLAMPGTKPSLRIVTPAAAEHILKTKFNNYVRIHPRVTRRMQELMGKGIFAVDGEEWKFQRKVASHMFSMRVLRTHMTRVFVEHGEKLIHKLGSHAATGEPVDMQDLFYRYTMDSICQIAFGLKLGGVEADAKPAVAHAFDRLQELVVARLIVPWPLLYIRKYFQIGTEKEITECAKVLNDFVHGVIKERLKALENVEAGEEKRNEAEASPQYKWSDLLSQFILQAKDKGETLTEEFLRDVTVNFMIAGRDTTACLLTWAFKSLYDLPHLEKKFLSEIDHLSNIHGVNEGKEVTEETVHDMKFAHAFFSETLRLYPSVPGDAKVALGEDRLPDGTYVPPETNIYYSPYTFGRLKSIWGDDSLEFKPDRWLDNKEPSQYQFISFNAGPRLCLGKHMAYLEAKIASLMLLNKFTFKSVPNQDFSYRISFILQIKKGLMMTVHPRDKEKEKLEVEKTEVDRDKDKMPAKVEETVKWKGEE